MKRRLKRKNCGGGSDLLQCRAPHIRIKAAEGGWVASQLTCPYATELIDAFWEVRVRVRRLPHACSRDAFSFCLGLRRRTIRLNDYKVQPTILPATRIPHSPSSIMAYPATTSSDAVLDARSASLLPPGLEAGAPVVDPREDQDDDADEMDLFLLQTEDEIQRREPSVPIEPSTPNVSYTQSTIHVKQESPYLSPIRPHADDMDGGSSAERKRKRPQAGNKLPPSPQRRSTSRHLEHEEDLLFHLKRKRVSSGSASRSAGQTASRHLATDPPIAAASGGTSSSKKD